MASSSSNLSSGFESLTLGGIAAGLSPPPDSSGEAATPRETGTVPKSLPNKLEKCSSTSSVGTAKKRRNRRQRRRRTMDDNTMPQAGGGDSGCSREKDDTGRKDEELVAMPPSPSADLDMLEGVAAGGRLPDLLLKGEEAIAQHFLEALKEEEEEEEEEETAVAEEATATPQPTRKAGGARRRRRKRKKQRSPDKLSDKENKLVEPKSDEDEEEDEDANCAAAASLAGGETRKYIWRSVVKSGAVKKCVLVEGRTEGGRPSPGDTVLVRSQGKLKDGTIVDDHSTLVFNVGEHEVVEGLDVAVRSMHKSELAIVSVKPEAAYGDVGRKGDIPPGSRITYLFGLMHFEKQKEVRHCCLHTRMLQDLVFSSFTYLL